MSLSLKKSNFDIHISRIMLISNNNLSDGFFRGDFMVIDHISKLKIELFIIYFILLQNNASILLFRQFNLLIL